MSITVLGCRLDPVDAGEATQRIAEFVAQRRGAHVITLGTEMVVYAQSDAAFRDVVNASALNVCDTVGLLKVANQRGAGLADRVTGVELIEHVSARLAQTGESIFLLGGAPGVADEAAAVLTSRYPGLRIAGTHHGFFDASETAAIVEEIRTSDAGLVLVGLGSPRQEFWIRDHIDATRAGAAIGVGGSFDVISGRVERAPEAWRHVGLEWLYRLVKEPHRWRRQLALPKFVWLVLLEGKK